MAWTAPGVGLDHRDAKQGRVATANDGREPGSRINPRETLLLLWSRWFALPSQLLDFAQFKGLTQLRVLGLSGTQVTDAGLQHLKGLTQLRKLYLNNTKVTNAGAESLRKALLAPRISR